MKSKIALVLAVVVLVCSFAMTACTKPEEEIIGTWKAQQVTLGVVTESVITFNADGTGSVTGLWNITGNINYVMAEEYLTMTYNVLGIENSVTYQFTIEDDTLNLTKDATTVTFTRVM